MDQNKKAIIMKLFYLCIVILLSFTIELNAGTISPSADDTKHIEYGEQHKCVVPVHGKITIDKQDKKYFASAVVIRPKVILTAAHVISEAKHVYIICDNKEIPVSLAIIRPQYNEKEMGPYDLAIGYLESEAKLDFYPELYSTDDEVDKICSLAGYGMTGTYNIGANKSDGKKRGGSNIIDGLANGMLICSVNKGKRTSLEFLICHGDSGGGLFINNKLAGIHSCIMTESGPLNANYKNESLHTRISLHKDWIDLMVEKLEEID